MVADQLTQMYHAVDDRVDPDPASHASCHVANGVPAMGSRVFGMGRPLFLCSQCSYMSTAKPCGARVLVPGWVKKMRLGWAYRAVQGARTPAESGTRWTSGRSASWAEGEAAARLTSLASAHCPPSASIGRSHPLVISSGRSRSTLRSPETNSVICWQRRPGRHAESPNRLLARGPGQATPEQLFEAPVVVS